MALRRPVHAADDERDWLCRAFSAADIQQIDQVAKAMEFLPVLTPNYAELPEFEAIASRVDCTDCSVDSTSTKLTCPAPAP